MNPPLDYPAENDIPSMDAVQAELTLAMLIDRHASEQPVTNEMIEQACRRIDTAQDFATGPQEERIDHRLARLLNVLRHVPTRKA